MGLADLSELEACPLTMTTHGTAAKAECKLEGGANNGGGSGGKDAAAAAAAGVVGGDEFLYEQYKGGRMSFMAPEQLDDDSNYAELSPAGKCTKECALFRRSASVRWRAALACYVYAKNVHLND